ncbi:MAG: hypothetical protein ABFD58_08050 [Anaerolineaceae bacterium]
MIKIEQVDLKNKSEVNAFVQFHYDLYKDCPQWVPPFYADIKAMLNPNKHPYYEHSDAEFFVAKQDGKIVGRIAAMENKPFNKYHESKKAQFYLYDTINDQEVTNALLDRTCEWAKKRGLVELIGPKGFGALDGYGILYEGYEHRQMMNMMNYNYPYYVQHLENYGFTKANDFVSCYLEPDKYILPEKAKAIADRIGERGNIYVKTFKNKKDLISWGTKIGHAYNSSFVSNWEYYPLTDNELKFVIDNVMLLADPRLMKIIMHKEDVIGFLFVFPDISRAMQRGKGHLNPISVLDLMREVKKTDWVSLNGVGILPEFQGRGGNALMYSEIAKTFKEFPFKHAEQTQMADTAVQIRKDMESLGAQIYKRHRVYGKTL